MSTPQPPPPPRPQEAAPTVSQVKNLVSTLIEGCEQRWCAQTSTSYPLLAGRLRGSVGAPGHEVVSLSSTPASMCTSVSTSAPPSLPDSDSAPVAVPSAAEMRAKREDATSLAAVTLERDQAMAQFDAVVKMLEDSEMRADTLEAENGVLLKRLRRHEQQAAKRQRQVTVLEEEVVRLGKLEAKESKEVKEVKGGEDDDRLEAAEAEVDALMAQNLALMSQLEQCLEKERVVGEIEL